MTANDLEPYSKQTTENKYNTKTYEVWQDNCCSIRTKYLTVLFTKTRTADTIKSLTAHKISKPHNMKSYA